MTKIPTDFGPIIPHLNGEVCPFPDAVGKAIFSDGYIGEGLLGDYGGWCKDGDFRIIAYRLPLNHHAYGPRASRMGREPDFWGITGGAGDNPFFKVNIYLKEKPQ